MTDDINNEEAMDPVIRSVLAEQRQSHETRSHLYEDLEEKLEMPVVALFTSFRYPVAMEDTDVDMLAGILQAMDLSEGLTLMISSPGGDGLAAERMINVCRRISGTGDFNTIVPGKAKSAATLVCFGSSEIMMGPTSELGPVDPQIQVMDNGVRRYLSAYHIVSSYLSLFEDAVAEEGNLEPYLQQLGRYDASIIERHNKAIELAEDISVSALGSGMMTGKSEEEIKESINKFFSPKATKVHGRPIFAHDACDCGINVSELDVETELWGIIYELYIRINHYVNTEASKCIESKDHSFVSDPQPINQGG